MGSRSTQKTEVPEDVKIMRQHVINRMLEAEALGPLPEMGPVLAAVNPYERARSQNVASMASAFGMAAPTGMGLQDVPTVTQGGVTGYSVYPAYIEGMKRLKAQRPAQYDYLTRFSKFDPITGEVNPDFSSPLDKIRALQAGAPAQAAGGGGGSDNDGPSHEEILQMHGHTPSSSTPSQSSGDFDPLGPSGNISIDLGNTVAGKIFGGLF